MDLGQSKQMKVQIDTRQHEDKLKEAESILNSPYILSSRAAIFREKYKEHIGYSIQGKQTSSVHLGVNASDVQRAIGCLGFLTLDADMAEHLLPYDDRLSLLILTMTDSPALGGTSYLMMKPGSGLTSSRLLAQTLRLMEDRMVQNNSSFLTSAANSFSHESVMPLTLSIEDRKLESILKTRPGTYLVKQTVRRGTDVQRHQLVRIRANHVQEDLLNFLSTSQFQSMECSHVVLQEYIERPLLVDKRKFDLRVYLLVVNPKRSGSSDRPWQCGHFVLCHPGFARLSPTPYDPSRACQRGWDSQGDVRSKVLETSTWFPDELNSYLNRKQRAPQQDWVKDVMYPKMGAALGYLATLLRSSLDDRDIPTSTFRILGVDFLVDANLRLHLLDLEEFPTWVRQTSVLADILPDLWLEATCLTSEIAIRYMIHRTVCDECLVTRQNFRMVYSSEDPCLARRNITLMYD